VHLTEIRINHHRFPTREYYPFSLPVIQQTKKIELSAPLTFFVGENGSGKSTVLDAVAHHCRIYIWQGDTRTRSVFNPYEGALYRCLSVSWRNGIVPGSFFSAELFKNFSRIVDEWAATDPGVLEYFGGTSLMTQSHGQSIMSFFKARFSRTGLYLLDEPEAALSPKTQLALRDVLTAAAASGKAQFLIATHSPILLSCPGAVIYSFDHIPVQRVPYKDTDHFKIYRDFMEQQTAAD